MSRRCVELCLDVPTEAGDAVLRIWSNLPASVSAGQPLPDMVRHLAADGRDAEAQRRQELAVDVVLVLTLRAVADRDGAGAAPSGEAVEFLLAVDPAPLEVASIVCTG